MFSKEVEKDITIFHKPRTIFLIAFILSFMVSALVIIKIEGER